jgi:hypothetical protein
MSKLGCLITFVLAFVIVCAVVLFFCRGVLK